MAESYPQYVGGLSSKQVTIGDTYGNMPAASLTGYYFAGWSGKNIIESCSKFQITDSIATYNSLTNEVTFASASSYSLGNGYSYVIWQAFSNGTFIGNVGAGKSNVGEFVGKETIRKSGENNFCLRLKANANLMDSGIDFDISNLPDGDYSVYCTIKQKATSSLEGRKDSFVVGDIMIERSSFYTGYEQPYRLTSETKKTLLGNETFYAIWKNNLFTKKNIVKYVNNCNYNETTKTLTFANASSYEYSPNSYGGFSVCQTVNTDRQETEQTINLEYPFDIGQIYFYEIKKESQYNYFEIRANADQNDSYLFFCPPSFENIRYVIRFKVSSVVQSIIDTSRYENFTIQDFEIFEA